MPRFPFYLHRGGISANRQHIIEDLIEQVLFTAPGERVNRPDFGCGLLQAAFGDLSDPVQTALEASIAGSLHRWLEDQIQVEAVQMTRKESELQVTVRYMDRQTRAVGVARVAR